MAFRLLCILVMGACFAAMAGAGEWQVLTEEYPPFNFIENGKVTGFSVEIVREMLRRMDEDVPVEMVSWARGYNLALRQPEVMLFSTGRNDAREDLFHWVGPLARQKWALFGRRGDGITIATLDDAKGVAAIGTYKDDIERQELKALGFTNLVMAMNDETNIRRLMAGQIDLWPSSTLGVAYIAREAGVPFEDLEQKYVFNFYSVYIAISKSTPEDTVARWSRTLDAIKADGTYDTIRKKWLPEDHGTPQPAYAPADS